MGCGLYESVASSSASDGGLHVEKGNAGSDGGIMLG